jgi:hypothetical protein
MFKTLYKRVLTRNKTHHTKQCVHLVNKTIDTRSFSQDSHFSRVPPPASQISKQFVSPYNGMYLLLLMRKKGFVLLAGASGISLSAVWLCDRILSSIKGLNATLHKTDSSSKDMDYDENMRTAKECVETYPSKISIVNKKKKRDDTQEVCV